MKINRASSLRPSSLAAVRTTFSLPGFLGSKLRSRAVAALFLLLSGFQLGVPIALAQDSNGGKSAIAGKDADAQQWSLQVDKVNPGNVIIERSFTDAIYENLLQELAKTNQFKQLYRSGDRNATDVHRLLILKYLELFCVSYNKRVADIEKYREDLAQQVWLVNALREHVPEQVFQDIWIQCQVNEIDPDFSFYKTVFGKQPEPVPALG